MVQLDCWLPEKEMFGVFQVDSVQFNGGTLCVVVSNEVFQFTIRFQSGLKAYLVRASSLLCDRFSDLQESCKILMRGNTFFKLRGDPAFSGLMTEGDTHFAVVSSNYMVDILASENPAVSLDMAPCRRSGGAL